MYTCASNGVAAVAELAFVGALKQPEHRVYGGVLHGDGIKPGSIGTLIDAVERRLSGGALIACELQDDARRFS